jgi:ATP-dependent DNA helicase RecG
MTENMLEGIMIDFLNGDIDILVCTTIIETGVDVPNANTLIIEDADRMGLSQLHQLRGRVGRGSSKSYCVLVSSSYGEASKERLDIMRTTYDGYTIAEHDLKMRGPGDFFSADPSIRQSGEANLNLSKTCSDTELLNTAFECAREILSYDRNLELPEHLAIKERAARAYENNSRTIN